MKMSGVWLMVASFLFMVGCSNKPYVETDYQADFNFSTLKVFNVAETQQDTKESILISPFTLSHIHAALEAELGKRYQVAASGAASDFIVNYHVIVEEKVDPRSYDAMYGYAFYGRGYHRYGSPFFYGPNVGVSVYNQGSLIVDIVDAKTNKPIWRGVSEKRLSRNMAPQQQRDVLSKAVTEVIAQFPPVQ